MVSDIGFGNGLTERTSVESEKQRTQYGALGGHQKGELQPQKKYHLFKFFVYCLKGEI